VRVLILSDIHSNLAALEAVLEAADEQGYDRAWCLGDIVGYGPAPNECVTKVRNLEALAIAGNHDWGALGRIPLEDFNPDAQAASLWTRDQLAPENVSYLEAQPETRVEGDFTLAHGSPRFPIWEYIQLPSIATANLTTSIPATVWWDTLMCLLSFELWTGLELRCSFPRPMRR
jgi:predicted phosphodiesterase